MAKFSNGAIAAALAVIVSGGLAFPLFLTKGKTMKEVAELRCSCHSRAAILRAAPFLAQRTSSCKHQGRRRSSLLACHCQSTASRAALQEALESSKRGIAVALAALGILVTSPVLPSEAVLNSPNAGIARTVDAALRRSIPASNADVRNMQKALEDIAFKLRIPQRKPWNQMTDDIAKATGIVNDESKVMVGVPAGQEDRARQLRDEIRTLLIRVNAAIEAKDADKVSTRTTDALESVAQLELVQAPGLPFSIPKDFRSFPRLTGRAIVDFTITRDTSDAFVGHTGGGGKPEAQIRIAVDGYSAPLTAGNFVNNILAGAYEGSRLAIGGETISVASDKLERNILPMEMLPLGEFDPVYRSQLDVQHGELPVLPLSIYGAVAMAHPGADIPDGYAAANEFFLYKFDRASSGLAGLSFEEGIFPVFGYVIDGLEYIPQLQGGDVIVSAKLVSGQERLVLPEAESSPATADS